MLRDHGAIVQCYAPMEAALVELDEAISSTAIEWRFWLVDDAVVGDGACFVIHDDRVFECPIGKLRACGDAGEYFLLLRGGGSQ